MEMNEQILIQEADRLHGEVKRFAREVAPRITAGEKEPLVELKAKLDLARAAEDKIRHLREPKYLPVDVCKRGWLYGGMGRNFELGVFDGEGFHGIRRKFADRFIDVETHWDLDDHYGTFKPYEALEECPIPLEDETRLLEWIDARKGEEK